MSLGGADVEGLVEKVGLKLVVEAVFGVEWATVEIHSGEHLMELLVSMESSNVHLYRLKLCIPHHILKQLPEALLSNLSKVTIVRIELIGKSLSSDFDFGQVLLALAENPFKKLKGAFLWGGSISEDVDSAKIANAIASLERVQTPRGLS